MGCEIIVKSQLDRMVMCRLCSHNLPSTNECSIGVYDEELKAQIESHKDACNEAMKHLIHAEQWSPKCEEFPRIAMSAIVHARSYIESI